MCCWLPLTHKFTTFKIHFKKFILIYLKPVILIKKWLLFLILYHIVHVFLHYFACIIIILCVCVCDVCADVCMCTETRGGAVSSLCCSLPYSPETGSLTDLCLLSCLARSSMIPLSPSLPSRTVTGVSRYSWLLINILRISQFGNLWSWSELFSCLPSHSAYQFVINIFSQKSAVYLTEWTF